MPLRKIGPSKIYFCSEQHQTVGEYWYLPPDDLKSLKSDYGRTDLNNLLPVMPWRNPNQIEFLFHHLVN